MQAVLFGLENIQATALFHKEQQFVTIMEHTGHHQLHCYLQHNLMSKP